MPQINDVKWSFIVDSIINQKTVLFIGPDITINYGDPEREKMFLRKVAERHPSEVLSLHEEDGFLVFEDTNKKLLLAHEISEFYKQDFSNPILEKISEIPFHLIISITPDLSLNHVFDEKQFDYDASYYQAKTPQNKNYQPRSNRPLIYNLLGSVKSTESLITSHYDLFKLIQSIYADRNLPKEITSVFDEGITRNIIFLGFDFNKWYFQLILHLLRINYEPCIRYATMQNNADEPLHTLCESHFKILFIDRDPEYFVSTLHDEFRPEQLRQSLPKPSKQRTYRRKNIEALLTKTFDGTGLEKFCLINFETVHENFTPKQGQDTRITALLDYVAKFEKWEELLDSCQEENPVQFKKFQPYYEEL